jgi:hypothetical protein
MNTTPAWQCWISTARARLHGTAVGACQTSGTTTEVQMAEKTFHPQAYPLWVIVPPDGVPLIKPVVADAVESEIADWITANAEADLIIGWFIGNPNPDGVDVEPVTVHGTVWTSRWIKFYGDSKAEATAALQKAIETKRQQDG